MAKVGRNAACPCGSGKKYKKCCLSKSAAPPPLKTTTPPDKRIVVGAGRRFFLNQFQRDAPKIEASFDRFCHADIEELGELASQIAAILLRGLNNATSATELRAQCAQLLINALSTFSAGLQILRAGYLLAPGVLTRNIVEILAVVCHLIMTPADLGRFRSGQLYSTSPDVMRSAKTIIPEFGSWYGYLSEQFTHIGKLHHTIQPVGEYKDKDDSLTVNLGVLRVTLWLLYVVTELLFIDQLAITRYWRRKGDGAYEYAPSDQERAWQTEFLEGVGKSQRPNSDRPAA